MKNIKGKGAELILAGDLGQRVEALSAQQRQELLALLDDLTRHLRPDGEIPAQPPLAPAPGWLPRQSDPALN